MSEGIKAELIYEKKVKYIDRSLKGNEPVYKSFGGQKNKKKEEPIRIWKKSGSNNVTYFVIDEIHSPAKNGRMPSGWC